MSADVAAYLPTLDDPVWVAWQAEQITRITRSTQVGTAGVRYRERMLYAILTKEFNDHLDQWHTWEWVDSIGGIVTVDRYAPEGHPHLGVAHLDGLDFDAVVATITETQQSLLRQVLADTQSLIGGI